MIHPLTEAARARWESRLSCDLCGEDQSELRLYQPHSDILCRACFLGRDVENSFTDFPLAQGAAE
jgi:formylmethanofuran dehydrogenase subunit E